MGIFDWKHWVVILIVVVLVFGTKRLKNLGSDVGEAIKSFRKSVNTEEEAGKPQVEEPKGTTIQGEVRKVDEPAKKN